ncbi:MAG: HAD family phosphatase [Candidatus Zixiibacteriota bacterium]
MNIGAIFDWDGVIIDSSRYHEESWEKLAQQENKALPHNYFKKSFGKRNETIIPEVLKWTRGEEEIQKLSHIKEETYRGIILERGLTPLPGVKAFLEILRQHNVPCAVGSSTPSLNITTALRILRFEHYFQVIIAAEDVTKGKPAPQVFLFAAQKLQLPPGQCVVFEDAHVGIAAARAGGMKVVAVATTNPASELTKADLVVHRLDELSIDKLKELF